MKRLVESLVKPFINESKKRVPRKKGQHRGSKSHSDLYTDENPKGTIKGLKFATVKDAEASVRKIKSSGRSHAHKIQAAVAMEQRAREMGKKSQAAVYRSYINKMKKKTKKKNEDINIPVEIGDTILTGRFKNKKVVVKSIDKDEHGMPTINGKKITTFRVLKNKTNQKNESSITSNIKGVKGYSPFVEDGQFDDYVAHLKKIFEKNGEKFILKEGVNDPGILKAVFLAGGPGSGKTYVTRGLFGIPKSITLSAFGLKVVNSDTELERMLNKYGFGTDLDAMPDEIFRQLTDPSYEDYSGLRTRAKELTQARRKLYTDGRLGMIIDGTGRKFKEISKQKNELEKIGYDTYMVFVHTKLEIAQKRNMARARKLSPELVEKSWNDVQANKGAFQGLFGSSNFLLVDNSQTLAEKAAEKKFKMLVKKGVGKFIKKPIKNYRGQNWVKKQKLLKKEVIQKVKEMMNYPNLLRPVAQVPAIQKDGEHRYYNPDTTKKKKKKKENTSVPYGSGYEKIKEQKEIKKIVGVYGGRFQPFGPHHKKTYEWLKKKVDDAYITTSNIKQPPRHPMNFKEKVRHMTKMGVPKNRIVQEKSPYVAKNVLSKYDPQTTAVVYIFGAKDAGRLKGGKYFQDYKKSKDNLNGFEDNGYVLTAPHVSINIAGKEVSGTTMRQLLGSPDMEKDREKLFKKAFGYFDKGIYNMMTNKFKKLFEQFKLTNEIIDEFLTEIDVNKIIKESTTGGSPTDDGPPTFYRGFNDYKKNVTNWIDDMYAGAGWKILNYILGKGALNPDYDYTLEYNVVPAVAYGRKQSGEYGTRFGVNNPIQSYKNYIEGTVLKNLGFTLLKWMGITPDGKSYTGVEVETPVLPGVGLDNVGNTTTDKLKLKERINLKNEVSLIVEDYFTDKSTAAQQSYLDKHPNSKKNLEPQNPSGKKERSAGVEVKTKPYSDEQAEEETGEYFENDFAFAAMPDLAKNKDDLKQKILDAPERSLSDNDLKNMMNTDAADVAKSDNPIAYAKQKAIEYDKSWDYITQNIKSGEAQEAPISVKDKEGNMFLLAGNTRLMAQTAFGNQIPVKVIDYDGQIKEPKIDDDGNVVKENILLEGGAYGHMNHPFDDKDLTFGDLKKIVDLGLQGRLDLEETPTEKTDGQNLMITFKKDKLLAARNKGQIKDKGKKAMDVVAVARKFQGRGDIKDAFVFAMQDLKKMVGKLSDAQKKKIFDEGGNFVNLEIIYPPTKNIIDYDKRLLQFHGATKYDENGNPKGQVRDGGRILAGMITQINANIGKKFKVQKPNFLTLKKSQNFGKKRDIYFNRIDKLKSQFGLKDTDTLNEYHQSYWMEFIFNAAKQYKYAIPNKVLMNLTKRWAFFDKSYSVQKIRADIDNQKFLDWFLSTDKQDHTKMVKENMKPFEILFFELGAEILKNISNFLAANPDKAVQTIRKDVVKAINVVRKGKDLKKLNTLKQQLSKLNAIGGFKSIVPAEGLVFKYKGKTYKFTGAFAPINQIIGLTTF